MTWLKNIWAKLPAPIQNYAGRFAIWMILVIAGCIIHKLGFQQDVPAPPPWPDGWVKVLDTDYDKQELDKLQFDHPQLPIVYTGWKKDPEAVKAAIKQIEAFQGFKCDFSLIAKDAIAGDDDKSVFFWEYEVVVLSKVLSSWDQSNIGSCVSHGWGRGVQDLILTQIALGGMEEWPGAEVCREAIYGGSRIEIGGGRIGGDGSVGAWAGQWVEKYGVLFYKNYPNYDLTGGYNVSRCRQWGNQGCPNALEPIAKEHPVKGVAMVKTGQDVWNAIGNHYPVPVCSDVGFDSAHRDGFCARAGSWGHCLLVRARFTHPSKGKCFVIQNSWGNYLKTQGTENSKIQVADRLDKVQLPEGCFAITWADMDRIVKQGDSFAISGFFGFPLNKAPWWIKHQPIANNKYLANLMPNFHPWR